MRRALFGATEAHKRDATSPQQPISAIVVAPPRKAASQKMATKAFPPRLRVTLRVGNEFEGKMHELIHEADTLSTLLAEQEATKAARKKFRYVEVISVNPI